MKQSMKTLTSQNTVEWYTPPWLIDRIIRPLLGGIIDLDPCSPSPPPHWIKARNFYTAEDDGLCCPWVGRVFVNPPFDNTPAWLATAQLQVALGQAERVAFLCNSAPGYAWWEQAWRNWPVILLRERVKFWYKMEGGAYREAKDAAKKGQAVIYLHHGGYIPTSTMGDIARQFGLAVYFKVGGFYQ